MRNGVGCSPRSAFEDALDAGGIQGVLRRSRPGMAGENEAKPPGTTVYNTPPAFSNSLPIFSPRIIPLSFSDTNEQCVRNTSSDCL